MGKKYYFSSTCYWDCEKEGIIRNNIFVKLPPSKENLIKKLLENNGRVVSHKDLYFAMTGGEQCVGNWKALLSNNFTRNKENDKGLKALVPEMIPFFEMSRPRYIDGCNKGGYRISIPEKNIIDITASHPLVQRFDSGYNEMLALNEEYLDRTKWEMAKKSSEAFIIFARGNLRELNTELPHAKIFPASQCQSDTRQPLPLFYAHILLLQGKLLLRLKPDMWRDDDEKGFYHVKAKEIFRQAANVAVNCARAEQIIYTKEKMSGKSLSEPVAFLISAEAYIRCAKCYSVLLKSGFGSEKDISAGQKVLDSAKAALASHESLYGACERLNALREKLKAVRVSLSVPSAVPEESEAETELVYSTAFDSSLGKTKTLEETELFMLQLVASPVKIVLQLPQLLDNPNIIAGLIHSPGFQMLCRKGKIVISSYRPVGKEPIIDPVDYVKNAFCDNEFRFSASEELNNSGNRAEFFRGLQNDLPFQELGINLGTEDVLMEKEKLNKIYYGYRIASEIFGEDTVRRYHQDPTCRPSDSLLIIPQEQLSLPQTIDARIRLLLEDEEASPDCTRKQLLCRLQELQTKSKAVRPEIATRSDYYSFLDRLTGYDEEDLACFKKLVDICYGISSGFRCANLVLEFFSDGDLSVRNRRVRVPAKDIEIDPAHMMETVIDSAKKGAAEKERVTAFDFEDVLYTAQTAGEFAENTKTKGLVSAKEITEGLSVGYMVDLSGKAFAVAFRAASTCSGDSAYIPSCGHEWGDSGKKDERDNKEFNTVRGGGIE